MTRLLDESDVQSDKLLGSTRVPRRQLARAVGLGNELKFQSHVDVDDLGVDFAFLSE